MRICPSCSTENVDEARFCLSCGASLVPACPACGAERPEGARFCPSCGTPFVEEAPSPPGQERRLVTILFADVTDSTGLGERLDPEQLRGVLDAYFQAMREEIEAEGGTVEKFIGDAVMAAFGVPLAHEDDPARALRAALRMRRRLPEVNRRLDERFGVELEIRTGVNTGEVLAATTPAPGEPMVTGDAVNVAARLEQLAEPGQIVVAERTARAARRFRFRELGSHELRGKQDAIAAVLLDGEAPGTVERGVPGLRAPMVGRDAELALLRTIYERTVAEGRPNLVTIYGDPGVGKSRLTAEFVAWAEDQESAPRIVRGRCLPYGDGITYWPLAEILKEHSGVLDTDSSDDVLDKIEVSCDAVLEADRSIDAERACRAIAYTVGLEFSSAPMRDLEPRQVRAEMHLAWRSFFSALAMSAPVLAVIEDIHWADPALLDLLEELAEKVRGPVLFACPARPELTTRRTGWGGGRRNHTSIALERLSPEDSDRLIRELLVVAELPVDVHRRILERAEGNPFFLEELVRHLIDRGQIVRAGDRWRAGVTTGEVVIPDTVQAVLAARIDLLRPEEKRALQRAAVVGRVFWPAPVGRLLNGDGERLLQTLERLEERELVLSRLGSSVAGEPEYSFKHILTRDVAYESLPRRERAPAHETVAKWIEETAATRGREFGELLAYHHVEAHAAYEGDDDHREELRRRAFHSLLEVAAEARNRFANTKAMRSLDRARELAATPQERIAVLEERGLTALNDYQGDLSWSSLREAIDLRLTHVPEDRRAIAWTCARALENPLRWPGSMKEHPPPEEVRRYLDVGFSHVDQEASEEGVRLLMLRAFEPFGFGRQVPFTRAEVDEAFEAGLRAAELARNSGSLELESAALDGATAAMVTLGLYGRAVPLTDRRLEIAERLSDPWEAADIYAMAAWNTGVIGDYADAVRLASTGRVRAGEAEGLAAHNLNWAGFGRFHLGDWDGLLETFEDAKALLAERAADPPYFMAHLFGAATFVYDARELVGRQRLFELLDGIRGSTHGGSTAASNWLAWILARRGELERAWSVLGESRSAGTAEFRPFEQQVVAELLVPSARWGDVPGFLEETREKAAEAGVRALPVHLDRLEGRAAAAAGAHEHAADLLGNARAGFQALSAQWERARTELDLAGALLGLGHRDDAGTALEAAAPDLERVGARLELARLAEVRGRLGG